MISLKHFTDAELITAALDMGLDPNLDLLKTLATRLHDANASHADEIYELQTQLNVIEDKAEYYQTKYEKEYAENRRLESQLNAG